MATEEQIDEIEQRLQKLSPEKFNEWKRKMDYHARQLRPWSIVSVLSLVCIITTFWVDNQELLLVGIIGALASGAYAIRRPSAYILAMRIIEELEHEN
jgi:hypothetical protein